MKLFDDVCNLCGKRDNQLISSYLYRGIEIIGNDEAICQTCYEENEVIQRRIKKIEEEYKDSERERKAQLAKEKQAARRRKKEQEEKEKEQKKAETPYVSALSKKKQKEQELEEKRKRKKEILRYRVEKRVFHPFVILLYHKQSKGYRFYRNVLSEKMGEVLGKKGAEMLRDGKLELRNGKFTRVRKKGKTES